jgi:general nucleoside transport system permease protein
MVVILRQLWRSARGSLGAIAVTLGLGFLIVFAVSDDPVESYRQLLFASFASPSNFALYLNRATPLILIAIGIGFAFRAGVFNVGGEGQLYMGAIACTGLGIALSATPGPVVTAVCMIGAMLAGAAWAWWPAVLKTRLAVDEVVTTLMGNFVALLISNYMVTRPLRDATAYGATSLMLPKDSWLPSIPGLPNATIGFPVALAVSAGAWAVLFRTEWGANLRAAGTNPRFAEAIGIAPRREVVRAMLVSGGLAGSAGAFYVLGVGHRFEQNFSPGFGLMALTVALLARLNPFGIVATGLFYALMLNGAAYMQIETDVPRSLVNLLTGLLVLLMTVDIRRRRRRAEVALP